MKRVCLAIWAATLLALALVLPVFAQDGSGLVLRLSRDFGYSSGGSQIQGTFSTRVSGPENLARVEFYLDGSKFTESSQPPFRVRFNTSDYSVGMHSLQAIGYTSDGQELRSNIIQLEFVSAQESWTSALRIIVPLFVIILAVILVSTLVPLLTSKGKKESLPLGAERNYGVMGGTICSRCGRPYSVHLWSLNMLVGKLDRCPHCGKWAIVRRYPLSALRLAEQAELENAQPGEEIAPLSEEEKLRKDLDASRYQDI